MRNDNFEIIKTSVFGTEAGQIRGSGDALPKKVIIVTLSLSSNSHLADRRGLSHLFNEVGLKPPQSPLLFNLEDNTGLSAQYSFSSTRCFPPRSSLSFEYVIQVQILMKRYKQNVIFVVKIA